MKRKVTNIPDDNHVVRRCPRDKQVLVNDELKAINPSFFELRQHMREDYLSCNWLEFFAGGFQQQLVKVKKSIIAKLKKPVADTDKAVVINVGKIKQIAKNNDMTIRVLHENKKDPSYSAIRGIPLDNSKRSVFEMWAREAVTHVEKLK